MQVIWTILALLALVLPCVAQDAPEGGEQGGEAEPAAGVEAEAPAWQIPDRERRKLEGYLEEYLNPERKSRADLLDKLREYVDKPVDDHSVLEDVRTLFDIVNRARAYNQKCGRKGRVVAVDVRPEVHGFPGGIGTVRYHLYLPKNYNPRQQLSSLIFCLPDNRRWPDGDRYIEEVWTSRSTEIADEFILATPVPQSKGESWTEPKSYARAMITLRHVCGTFGSDAKTAGPAVDMCHLFLDGGEEAAVVAARFAEMFRGVILRRCTGAFEGEPDLRASGALHGVPAFLVFDAADTGQAQFADKVRAANERSVLAPVEAGDEDFLGDAAAMALWLKGLPNCVQPTSIEYTVHEPSFQRHYWINVMAYDAAAKPAPWFTAATDRATNTVRIEVNGITRFELFLNDALADLGKELRVVIVEGEQEYEFFRDTPSRDVSVLLDELVVSNHPWRLYPVRFVIDVPALREKAQAAAAAGGVGE